MSKENDCSHCAVLNDMVDQKEDAINDLADRLRDRDKDNARLSKLLIDNGIDIDTDT